MANTTPVPARNTGAVAPGQDGGTQAGGCPAGYHPCSQQGGKMVSHEAAAAAKRAYARRFRRSYGGYDSRYGGYDSREESRSFAAMKDRLRDEEEPRP